MHNTIKFQFLALLIYFSKELNNPKFSYIKHFPLEKSNQFQSVNSTKNFLNIDVVSIY